MLRGEGAHSGFIEGEVKPPFRLVWAVEFEGERLGTSVEPIVSGGRLFIATHAGVLYALSAETGMGLWRFQANGAFLNSPAVAEGLVIGACSDGYVYALDVQTGNLRWRRFGGAGGFSAAPVVVDGKIFLGSRAGDFLAISVKSGEVLWRCALPAPVRQTAAVRQDEVFVTAEDLRVRCLSAVDGKLRWTSEQLPGQTARDYYPVVVMKTGLTYVVVRTNPTLGMAQRIERDRTLLCRNAGVDDSSWQKLDAWTKSDQARGTPDLWTREQQAITEYLKSDGDARSFFVLDASTGKELGPAPILWAAGCQAVGAQPALTRDGRLLVFYRSAYGNWNHGVSPLVALGLLDLEQNRVTPLFHQQGMRPLWNCFWGTADESQNFLVVGDTVLIIHQGTLSGFDLKQNELFPIWGERDSYGGFRNPPWARNEWHGPGRSGVAVVGKRIYWQTGSRVLCLVSGEKDNSQERAKPATVSKNLLSATAPTPAQVDSRELKRLLNRTAGEILQRDWAPLFIDPGLAGRIFAFETSGEMLESLAWAFPHLSPELQAKAKIRIEAQWKNRSPVTPDAWQSLAEGARREWHKVPKEYCARVGVDKPPHPFAFVAAVEFYSRRSGEGAFIIERWPGVKACFEGFVAFGWKLDPDRGDLFANRYLASLLAVEHVAAKAGDSQTAAAARAKAKQTEEALVAWWKRAAEKGTLKSFSNSSELDPFIGKGDGISFAVAPHRHKLALFDGLTPEIAGSLSAKCPEAVEKVWSTFAALCPTWHLSGEERQVHFGENFVDPPDFAISAFRAFAWLEGASKAELDQHVDLPFCQADLYYLMKLAIALESNP